MREIKFKGWLAGIGKMTYPHTLDELMNWNTKPEDNGTATWLQYTGLKDKNGKEIYEGDIVLISGDKYVIEWEYNNAAFSLAFPLDTGGILHSFDFSDVHEGEVIGNIYENPELLKEEQS